MRFFGEMVHRPIVAAAAVFALVACQAPITDPDKDDDHDVDHGSSSGGKLIDGSGSATDGQIGIDRQCAFATATGTPTKTCYRRTAANADTYVSISCDQTIANHKWVSAIGNSFNAPLEVWVAVPHQDDRLVQETVTGPGGVQVPGDWVYGPESLIHDEGTITGHKQCGDEHDASVIQPNPGSAADCPAREGCQNTGLAKDPGEMTKIE